MSTQASSLPKVPLADINLSNPEFWLQERAWRYGAFKTLRDESPYQFFEEWEFENSPIPRGPGYIALTRHDDIWHVSRHPELFCSGKGSNIGDLTVELNEFFGSMINMDDPKHFRLRSIVSRGFAPREIKRVEEYVVTKAKEVVDNAIDRFSGAEFDFVEEIASRFPLEIICEMMGIPKDDYKQVLTWTNTILGVGDPELV
ncbi:MAG: cytochrome P450, partial [Actinomycetota bacterium]